MPINTVLEGPLSKWTNMLSGWQYRWFVLDPLNGLMSYYTSKENMSKGERRGCIRLNKGAVYVGYDNEDDITFTITVDEKTFHLQARNLDEREKWVNKIDRTIRYHATSSHDKNHLQQQLLNDEMAIGSASELDMSTNDGSGVFDLNKFDTELAESDAYLQLLIEQLKILETKRMRLLQASISTSENLKNTQTIATSAGATEVNILDPTLNSFDGNHSDCFLNLDESYSSLDDEKLQSIISSTEIAKANSDPNSNVGELTNDLNQVISNFNKSQSHSNLSKF